MHRPIQPHRLTARFDLCCILIVSLLVAAVLLRLSSPGLQSKADDPELFQLALKDIQQGDKFAVSATWMQPMQFENGEYVLKVLLCLCSKALLPCKTGP